MITSEDQIWMPVKTSRVELFNQLSRCFESYEKKHHNCFPRLRDCTDIVVASDYSGEHKEADYSAYSFLVFDWNASGQWSLKSSEVRESFLSQGNREMAYKKLGDKYKQLALFPFLEAANNINGLLITLLVKKRVQSVLEPGGVAYLREIEPSLVGWKNETIEKLYRILAFLAFLHAGFCHSDQRTYWLTDNDEIAANPERLTSAVRMLQRISTDHFARRIHLGSADTVNSMDVKISGQIKDIASIPDLVGGALVDAWSATARCGLAGGLSKPLRMPEEIPEKAKAIIEWFMQQDKPLRRHFAVIDLSESDPNLLDFNWLRFSEAQL